MERAHELERRREQEQDPVARRDMVLELRGDRANAEIELRVGHLPELGAAGIEEDVRSSIGLFERARPDEADEGTVEAPHRVVNTRIVAEAVATSLRSKVSSLASAK